MTWSVVEDWDPLPFDGATEGNGLDFSGYGTYGVAVGTGGFIARSTDSGVTWNEMDSGVTTQLNAVTFMPPFLLPTPTTVYAVGSSGLVLKSEDNGATWEAATRAGSKNLHGVSFANPSVGYVVGKDQSVYRTINGGLTWNAENVGGGNSGEIFYDVQTWGDGSQAILVGQNGGVYVKTTGLFRRKKLGSLAVTETLNDVEVLNSGTNVRICGDNGVVLFRDSGVWTKPRSLTNEDLYKLAFQSPTHGFAVGWNFLIGEYGL